MCSYMSKEMAAQEGVNKVKTSKGPTYGEYLKVN